MRRKRERRTNRRCSERTRRVISYVNRSRTREARYLHTLLREATCSTRASPLSQAEMLFLQGSKGEESALHFDDASSNRILERRRCRISHSPITNVSIYTINPVDGSDVLTTVARDENESGFRPGRDGFNGRVVPVVACPAEEEGRDERRVS